MVHAQKDSQSKNLDLRTDSLFLRKQDPNIRYTDKFDDPNLSGEMQTSIILKQVFCGTDLSIAQEGIPAAIPAEACYLGWQESLTLLAKLVEAEIPDQQ